MTSLSRHVGIALVILFTLCACGQKGPLFLPSEDPTKKTDQERR